MNRLGEPARRTLSRARELGTGARGGSPTVPGLLRIILAALFLHSSYLRSPLSSAWWTSLFSASVAASSSDESHAAVGKMARMNKVVRLCMNFDPQPQW